jgi:hypothetical protein
MQILKQRVNSESYGKISRSKCNSARNYRNSAHSGGKKALRSLFPPNVFDGAKLTVALKAPSAAQSGSLKVTSRLEVPVSFTTEFP